MTQKNLEVIKSIKIGGWKKETFEKYAPKSNWIICPRNRGEKSKKKLWNHHLEWLSISVIVEDYAKVFPPTWSVLVIVCHGESPWKQKHTITMRFSSITGNHHSFRLEPLEDTGKKTPNPPSVACASGQSSTFPFSNESLRHSREFHRSGRFLANFNCWKLFLVLLYIIIAFFLRIPTMEVVCTITSEKSLLVVALVFIMLPSYLQSERESDNPITLLSRKSVHHIMESFQPKQRHLKITNC